MTLRSLILLPLAMTALALGMSTGQGLYYLLFFSAAALCLLGLITVIWLKATLKCTVTVRERRVDRGGPVHMAVQIDHRCPLPMFRNPRRNHCTPGLSVSEFLRLAVIDTVGIDSDSIYLLRLKRLIAVVSPDLGDRDGGLHIVSDLSECRVSSV